MSSKALRQMYKEHHICIHCGQNDAMPGRVSCAECLAKDLERHTKAYENLSGETKAAYLQNAMRDNVKSAKGWLRKEFALLA